MKQKNVFDRRIQTSEVESKIIVALERIAEAFRVLLWNETKQYGLSPIQVQLLIFIMTHPSQQCKVGYLAQEFNMTKATISDAIKVLEKKGLLERKTESNDNRSYIFQLNSKGKKITEKISLFANPLRHPLQEFTNEEKENLLSGLLHLIYNLHQEKIIALQRMCFTCRHYSAGKRKDQHYCKLLQMPLQKSELRIDCPEHEYAG
ncbi:MarR family winged helix-turn-helix transcriptional regulator [Terrimonas pollutisoli]|uniref:MarR family winged helix-turn-helix transcriptional regulator n=1 Tax=Terrimonas pollutisoli TaxID=3034147 RepID=UPI0023ED6A27|nr:MarR family winged helix-turn-helix transcriptional regulator [Terrimonas sp. H1YJ31]